MNDGRATSGARLVSDGIIRVGGGGAVWALSHGRTGAAAFACALALPAKIIGSGSFKTISARRVSEAVAKLHCVAFITKSMGDIP